MTTITIKDTSETLIKKHYKNTFTCEKVKIESKKYIDSDEYKNEEYEIFQNMGDLISDLQKYKK